MKRVHATIILLGLGAIGACAAPRAQNEEARAPVSSAPIARGSPPRSVPVQADNRGAIQSILLTRCAMCHDAEHTLPLVSAPADSEIGTWQKIWEAVTSSRMPPPSDKNPFPLDPEQRRMLGAYARAHSLATKTAPVRAKLEYSVAEWVSLADAMLTTCGVTKERTWTIAHAIDALDGLQTADGLPQWTGPAGEMGQLNIRRLAVHVCERAATCAGPSVPEWKAKIFGTRATRTEPTADAVLGKEHPNTLACAFALLSPFRETNL